jgi:ribosome biogenesis GTPase / thiamine phosphate phosphatase
MKNNSACYQGIITKKSNLFYSVHCGEMDFICKPSPRLNQEPKQRTTGRSNRTAPFQSLVVGDRVTVEETGHQTGVITDASPRRNLFSRRAAAPHPGAFADEQIIAANIDQVVPVFAVAEPAPHWKLLDRYLVTAEAQNIPVLIGVSKTDLLRGDPVEAEIRAALAQYQQIGYPVYWLSAYSGEGIEAFKLALQGKFSVFLGKSGVGKTSLLNALQPGLGLKTRAVNATTGKGRHTTSHLEMFALDFGGSLLDVPGNREFGLWDIDPADLAFFFPEMRPFLGRCKFGLDCRHDEEPGCAVRKAVMAEQISPQRYQSYIYLLEET